MHWVLLTTLIDIFIQLQEKLKPISYFSIKSFKDFLHHSNEEPLLISSTDAHKVKLIMIK